MDSDTRTSIIEAKVKVRPRRTAALQPLVTVRNGKPAPAEPGEQLYFNWISKHTNRKAAK